MTPVPGLLTRVIRDDGGLEATTIHKEFDSYGNPMLVHGPRWDGGAAASCSGCSAGSPSAEGTVTRYTYDDWGRVLTRENALGIVTRYEYDARGNLTSEIEDYTADGVTGRNVETTYEYDANGQLTRERTAADGIVRETVYTYDITRRLRAQTDGNGNTTAYNYDDAGQLIAMTDPLSHTTTFGYTPDGELERITLPWRRRSPRGL